MPRVTENFTAPVDEIIYTISLEYFRFPVKNFHIVV